MHGTRDHGRVQKTDSIVLLTTDKTSGTVEIMFQKVLLCTDSFEVVSCISMMV